MKKILSLLLFLFLFFVFSSKTFASEKFSTDYNVTYKVLDNQTTQVTLNIDLINKTSDYYAASYTVQSGFKDIENIRASDSEGELKHTTNKTSNGTDISFDFNHKAVGINTVQKFSVYYETSDIAKNYNNIWEVNIPGISNQLDYTTFNTIVSVPDSFGQPTIIKPSIANLKSSKNTLLFSKNDLGKSGVSITYGDKQIYEFKLNYHLYNKNLFPITTEIAIPSNNNYQEIKISDINPRPVNVSIDSDGNWLASYILPPSKNQKIEVKGTAKISYKPEQEILTPAQKKLYLGQQKYWEVNNPNVAKLAKQLKTPRAIYDYVVDNLKYDSGRIKETQTRAGAAAVLGNKNSAVCLEFTDLFIALARSAGIPARQVEGFANTDNTAQRPLSLLKDVLHSWPEYYDFDKRAWIMVDPTWENTTKGLDYFNVFDFDHFAFIIKGANSSYPVAAGGYKIPGKEDERDVEVVTAKNFEIKSTPLTASTNFSKNYLSGFPISGEIVIYNLSGIISSNQTFNISSEKLSPHSQNLYFDKIPPFGKRVIKINFDSKPILTNEADNIKITVGTNTINTQIVISPFYKNIHFYFIFGGIIFGSIIIVLSIAAYKSRRLHVS